MVREVLRDALPTVLAAASGAGASVGEPTLPSGDQTRRTEVSRDGEWVVLDSDEDLRAFVARLVQLFDNPRHRQDLRHGRMRFRLARSAGGPASADAPAAPDPVVRIERGAVTEKQVRDASRAGARLVLGRAAVLTPLARDRARALGVHVEKER